MNNKVEHPSYYQGNIEVIDFIEDKNLNFNLGNVIKYVARAGKKDPNTLIEDLQKASWYLEREINRLDQQKGIRLVVRANENGWLPTEDK